MITEFQPVSMGDLRDYVTFYNVQDVINPTTGLSEQQWTNDTAGYACVRPVGTQAFYAGQNMEVDITHILYTPYRSDAYSYEYVQQIVILLDTGSTETRNFEVVRCTDYNGRFQFTRMDLKLVSKTVAS